MAQQSVINQHIQDCFVHLAVTSKEFLKLVRGSVPSNYFTSEVTVTIVTLCYNYFDQFEKAPENHLHDELFRRIKNKDQEDRKLYTDYIKRIASLETPNVDYVLHTISDFVRARTFEEAAVDFVKLVDKGKFQEARYLMHEALRAGVEQENLGLEYFENDTPTYYHTDLGQEIFPTGIEKIDLLLRGGLKRGWLICVLGGYKGKKSWCVSHLAKHTLLRSMNVLHISHEMKLEEVEERYDRMLGGLTDNEGTDSVKITEMTDSGSIRRQKTMKVKSIYNSQEVKRVRKVWKRFGGRLIIKKYPMGTCTMMEIERYLNYLETYHSFIPDMLINDYPDIMSISTSNRREEINKIYIDHKKIADERNILTVCVSQATRSALQKAVLKQSDFAEDIRKLGNVDLVLAISNSEHQEQEEEMRVWILGGRSVQQGRGCIIKQNLDIGQFCTDSWFLQDSSKDDQDDKGD